MNREQRIQARLESDYNYLAELGYDVLGVFLQGSQNYELDYEGSDIDTKAIVLPSLDDIVFNRKPVSTTHILENNEHIDIKDIRIMHQCIKKQNINIVEILFTKFKKLNPVYADLYQPMFDNRDLIAHYNEKAAVNCMCGTVYEKYKALEHPYPTLLDKIEKYGYDPKQLHHIIRVTKFMEDYIAGVPYSQCLVMLPDYRKYLIEVKQCPPKYSLEEAREIAAEKVARSKAVKDRFIEDYGPAEINMDAENVMNSCLMSVMKLALKNEVAHS